MKLNKINNYYKSQEIILNEEEQALYIKNHKIRF